MEDYSDSGDPNSKRAALNKIRNLFTQNFRKYGDPGKPTTEGFVAIVLLGKDAWNAWRHAYPAVRPDFGGVDFRNVNSNFAGYIFSSRRSQQSEISFDGAKFSSQTSFVGAKFGYSASFNNAEFGDFVDFSNAEFGDFTRFIDAKFGNRAKFIHCSFGESCSFDDAVFGESANFSHSTFGDSAKFCRASFGDHARFTGCTFSHAADFSNTTFGDIARFDGGCTFGNSASFTDSKFEDSANFIGSQFGDAANFYGASFGTYCKFDHAKFGTYTDFTACRFVGKTHFEHTKFGSWLKFEGTEFSGKTFFLHTTFFGDASFAGDTTEGKESSRRKFQEISFAGSIFLGDVDFTGRQFCSTTDFGTHIPKKGSSDKNGNDRSNEPVKTRFYGIPEFHECHFHQNTSFDQAFFAPCRTPKAARGYRTLKGAMAKLNSIGDEQKFFRLEIQAEYPALSRGRKFLYDLYSATSFYGVSIVRPALTLLLCSVLIGSVHGLLANLCAGGWFAWPLSEIDLDRTSKFLRYVLIDTFPLPGFEKTQIDLRSSLFGQNEWIETTAVFFEIAHKFLSLGCYFLLGLAFRNLFKMKS
jgi:hypothetical protein